MSLLIIKMFIPRKPNFRVKDLTIFCKKKFFFIFIKCIKILNYNKISKPYLFYKDVLMLNVLENIF